jgi:hypothetical protein
MLVAHHTAPFSNSTQLRKQKNGISLDKRSSSDQTLLRKPQEHSIAGIQRGS